jgi:hypothetical protein
MKRKALTDWLLALVIVMLAWLILSQHLRLDKEAKEDREELLAELSYNTAIAEQLYAQREHILSGDETYSVRFLTSNSVKRKELRNMTIKMESANRLLDEMRLTLLTAQKGDMDLYRQKQEMLGTALVRWVDDLRNELNSAIQNVNSDVKEI